MRAARGPWYLLSLGLGLWLPHGETLADSPSGGLPTATPIKHLVVIYPENSSFDRYFGVYPVALNPEGSPAFEARLGTPSVNGLSETLLEHNPNLNHPVVDGEPAGSNPFRIARLDSYTCDMNHDYTPELEARNQGLMNQYVEFGDKKGAQDSLQFCSENSAGQLDTDLGYFDGNTVTALWNYAQHFAIADNFFATSSGESTRGHLNLVAGDISGVACAPTGKAFVNGSGENFPECDGPADSTDIMAPTDPDGDTATLVDDSDGFWDVCSDASKTAALAGRNIGDLLNDAAIPWGWFAGGFAVDANGECTSEHFKVAYCAAIDPSLQAECESQLILDYVPHHNPFQVFQSTANPQHLPPSSVSTVGLQDQANHLYDLSWFWQAANNGNLPAVSFLKPPIVNRSATSLDVGSEAGEMLCGAVTDGDGARCAYGPRLPFLVISPWAKENYVSSALIDQTSILRFIEDNWLDGERISDTSFDNIAGSIEDLFDFDEPNPRRLFLDPSTGEIAQ